MKSATAALLALVATLAVRCADAGAAQPCNALSSDFQQCVRAALQHLIPALAGGVPNIGAKGVDPLQDVPPVVHLSHGLKTQLDAVSISGLAATIVDDINVDLASNTIRIRATIPSLAASGIHTTDANIMGVPLKGSGQFVVSLTKPSVTLTLSGVRITGPDGQAYLRLSQARTAVDLGSAAADIKGFFSQFPPLEAAASIFANSVAAPVLEYIKPSLEKWLAAVALERAQDVFGSVPYDSIFPGRTSVAVGLHRALPSHPLSSIYHK